MSSTSRERIARLARALAAKTAENGCTEDEAISAAEKLAEMLAAHNMTLDEAMMREQPFATHREHREDAIGERLWKPASAIALLTGSRYWRSPAGVWPVSITFFGFDHEVEVSKYLLAICARSMEDGQRRVEKQHALINKDRRRSHVLAYLDGMADTLERRIRALKPKEPTGTGLIVVRDALIDAALKDANIQLRDTRARGSRDFDPSYAAGALAAERVRLDRGVTGPENQSKGLLR
ncbi:hypothetical protein [Mesorhizobium sp.]|uniref:DUF7168 domain-containing protein n=1 Tax=Mesorhizobium sp. TaxID=1871066 RepID=UPI000FE4C038|nr:hypothetical protein [Mesorhizobium sp.]RWP29894.1 MAG: hypothetical protein EOR03_25900 [Mesorhizobium sp.]